MKKVILAVAVLMSSLTVSFGGEGDKVKVISNDTTSSKVIFDVHSNETNDLLINLAGISSEMASVSLIDQKGESLFYNFVNSSEEHIEIDLTGVKPGIYYVKLNMDSEIRMKMVVVDKQ